MSDRDDLIALRRLAELEAKAGAVAPKKPETTMMQDIGQGAGNLAAGALRGAGSIGATLLAPIDMVQDAMAGKGLSLESNRARRQAMDEGLATLGADTDSSLYTVGKIAGETAGTMGAGGVLANGVRLVAPGATGIINALASGGFRAGANPGVQNMMTRIAGGAGAGAASAGLVDPEYATTGAVVGGALPPALAGAGKIGGALGKVISGPAVNPAVQQVAQAARQQGYVMSPTQVNPSLVNRTVEGLAGKLTTAQNASAKNQPITNDLAKKAIGAADLTPAGIQAVRDAANTSYDNLAQVGSFTADPAFQTALQQANTATAAMRQSFPALVNPEIDNLIESLSKTGQFDAQSTIEAIKQFRFEGAANRAAQDPAKKALGKAQMQISSALEDLIDRNLQTAGSQQLLTDYRAARQTLAKVYDVEKTLNPATGNVDAAKIGKLLAKGRPLTKELRDIAEFALQFPKNVRTPETMGSLPQNSPLDWGALVAASLATGSPLPMAGLLARPAARAGALSGPVQNRLVQSGGQNRLAQMLSNPDVQRLPYLAAPQLSSSR